MNPERKAVLHWVGGGEGLKVMESGRRISEKRMGLTLNYKQTGLIHLS